MDVTGALNRTRAYVADGDAAGLVQITVYREDARALLDALEHWQSAHADICERYTVVLRENVRLLKAVSDAS